MATSSVYSIANKLAGFIRGLFRAQSKIYDGAFSLKLLRAVTCSLFLQKGSVKDVRLGLKYGFGSSSDIWKVWATIEKIGIAAWTIASFSFQISPFKKSVAELNYISCLHQRFKYFCKKSKLNRVNLQKPVLSMLFTFRFNTIFAAPICNNLYIT